MDANKHCSTARRKMMGTRDSAKCLDEHIPAKTSFGDAVALAPESGDGQRRSSFSVRNKWWGRQHQSEPSLAANVAKTEGWTFSGSSRRRVSERERASAPDFEIPADLPLSWAAVPQKVVFTPRRHSAGSVDSSWRDEVSDKKRTNSAQRALRLFLELESTRPLREMAAEALATPPDTPPPEQDEPLPTTGTLRRANATAPRDDGDGFLKHASMEEDTVGLQAGLGSDPEADGVPPSSTSVNGDYGTDGHRKHHLNPTRRLCSLFRRSWPCIPRPDCEEFA